MMRSRMQTKQYGWQFLYMGADQDAIEVGASLGVAAANSVTYGRGKTREAMVASAGKVSHVRAARMAGAPAAAMPAFTDAERAELAD